MLICIKSYTDKSMQIMRVCLGFPLEFLNPWRRKIVKRYLKHGTEMQILSGKVIMVFYRFSLRLKLILSMKGRAAEKISSNL